MSGSTSLNALINEEGKLVGTKKRDAIIASIKSRLKKTIYKYGIEVQSSVNHARSIDMKNASPKILYNQVSTNLINDESTSAILMMNVQ